MKAEGFVKVVIDLEGEILGYHLVGPDASVLAHEVVAMNTGSGTVQEIRSSVHLHPALPEVVQRAISGQSGTVASPWLLTRENQRRTEAHSMDSWLGHSSRHGITCLTNYFPRRGQLERSQCL